MNTWSARLTPSSTTSCSFHDASQPAKQAIIDGDMSALRPLIAEQNIRAGTRTSDGSTMLMHAIQAGNIDAFHALRERGIDAQCLQCKDPQGEDVFFSFVRWQGQRFETDDVNVPGFRAGPHNAPWQEAFEGFFDQYAHRIDWNQTNWDGYDLHTLAHDLAHVECANFLERYMPPRELEEPLEDDNSLRFAPQNHFSLIPSNARATHAIASGDNTTLGRLIVAGDINASTLTPDGEPLSVFCLKCGQLRMFNALVHTGTSMRSQLTRVWGAHGSLVHSMVRGVDDEVLAQPSNQPHVRDFLVDFFNVHYREIDWTRTDRENRDPVTLAESLGREEWARFLSAYANRRELESTGSSSENLFIGRKRRR